MCCMTCEYKQPIGFDINFWAGGLVLDQTDDLAELQMSAGYPGQSGWPTNGKHYQVAVLAKDGNYDLEKGNNLEMQVICGNQKIF